MMTQAGYLSRLEVLLQPLPEQRKWEILDDIRQHFDEGMAAGLSEEALAESLSAPELLAQEYLSLYEKDLPQAPLAPALSHPAKPRRQGPGFFGKLGRGTMLFFVDLCLGLPVFLSLWAVWFALWISGVAMGFAGIAVSILTMLSRLFPIPWVAISFPLFSFFLGLTVSALGFLLLMGMGPMGRGLGRMTGGFIRWNGRVMGGSVYDA